MTRSLLCVTLTLLIGCPAADREQEPVVKHGAGASLGADSAELLAVEAVVSQDPRLVSLAERLPEDWAGTGTLASREAPTAGAPAWVAIQAEVISEEGQRYLRASGEAKRINNPMLARTAAANRARAEIAEWLGTNRLVGSEILEYWGAPGQAVYARARIRVPANWRPGMEIASMGAAAPPEAAPAPPSEAPQAPTDSSSQQNSPESITPAEPAPEAGPATEKL